MIRTKIVSTLGPASGDLPVLRRLARAGADVFRLNFSHGTRDDHARMLKAVREVSKEIGEPLGVMADLCGPKIRVGKIAGGSVLLAEGAELTIQRKAIVGTAQKISTTLPELIDAARIGHRIRLDDGKIELKVVDREAGKNLQCQVVVGGILASGKGVNVPKTNLKLSALTEKDRSDARWLAKQDVDYVALSFVSRAADVKQLRKILAAGGSDAKIIAKIEKPRALRNIHAILDAADGIMVARGDLGVEMSLPEVPIAQKRLVHHASRAGKVCIVATQMLESMTEHPSPTRAEVSDVANAALDGADAVMLSGETAIGKYPAKAVQMMERVVAQADKFQAEVCDQRQYGPLLRDRSDSDDLLAIAEAVRSLVTHEAVKAVAVLTISGGTAVALSKMQLPVPILGLTRSQRVVQQMCLLYGVMGRMAPACEHTREVLAIAGKEIRRLRWAKSGEKILVVSGRPLGKSGTINTVVVHTV